MLLTKKLKELAAGVGALPCYPFYWSSSGSVALPTVRGGILSGKTQLKVSVRYSSQMQVQLQLTDKMEMAYLSAQQISSQN